MLRGSAAGNAAWERLMAGSERFRRAERRFSAIWATALLTECVVKVVGAYTVPVHTMVWLGTVLTVVAVLAAMLIAGGSCADPMEKMVKAEVGAEDQAEAEAEVAVHPGVLTGAPGVARRRTGVVRNDGKTAGQL
ncbi:hypothetical protein [Streptomyces sp. NEAU-S7GS2]|uniref:hypothetical protein n=1 Tax=Streptomyces sp. NEAU-S7GS2 TaxID=2202000 RepID=UPI001EF6871A|nr:hypothetical protein [Streptomyces sp. NEAU-S7GS2]